MAGSYNHIVENDGNFGSPEWIHGMIENGGDFYEALEELFGMIWWLAAEHVNMSQIEKIAVEKDPRKRFNMIKDVVEQARQSYTDGLEFSKAIHALVPDQRRD